MQFPSEPSDFFFSALKLTHSQRFVFMRKSDNKDSTSNSQDETSELEVKTNKFVGTKAEMATEIERLNALLEEKEQELREREQSDTPSGKSFPTDGDHDVDFWSEVFGVTPRCVNEWIKKYEIPVWGPSDKNFMVNAEDFRSAFDKRILK